MEKIPCIECTNELWKYIKPYLEGWGYSIRIESNFNRYPYLVINATGILGECRAYETPSVGDYNRILLTDVEEFLEKSAMLKGFNYKRKDIMKINGIEIKPGMIITCKNGADYIAFPTKKGLAFASIFVGEWTTTIPEDIIAIRDLVEDGCLTSGKILWKKPKEKIVLTMDEIAEKFGYDVEQIQIKK